MRLEQISCPYCKGEDSRPWAEDNGYSAVQCTSCGFVFVNPRPPLDGIEEATKTGLHETEAGKLDVVGPLGFRRAKVKMFKERLRELFPGDALFGREVRWLDIGCGFGELLVAVEDLVAPGSVIEGVEPSEPKARVARQRGLRVKGGTLEEVDRNYSFLSMINVFSHLPQPRSFLTALPKVLEPGGRLLLVTGNGADVPPTEYPDPLFLPDHLVFAGETHVRGLLEETGFEVIRIRAYRYFLPEPAVLIMAKNAARRLLGRPTMPLRNKGPYRSMFVHARRLR
ncbi:MAG: class I SAM-dependent methyltransferase [Gemmatimonadota bacterium]